MAGRLPRSEVFIHRRSNDPVLDPERWEALVLPVDKPGGLTSFDVIRRLRRVTPVRKIGHAGTLDPMATGLLVCLVGRATKLMESFMEDVKTYTGVIRLGQTTPSYDADTEVSEERSTDHIDPGDVARAVKSLEGDIVQQTPMYSAAKVGGERLYKKARRGETISRPPRHVSVYRFDVDFDGTRDVRFEVECSKGTYVRALAHDLGQKLGVGAHLVELRRTASGPLSVDDAWPLADLIQALSEDGTRG